MNALEIDMSVTEARQVTQRINLLLGNIADTTSKVLDLIERAEAGAAWRALSYPSWTAYVSIEFSRALERLTRAERIPITAKLSETGMSTRAIGSVVGVSKDTVHRDLQQVSHADTPATGTDGKTYPRPATFLPSGKPDARTTEEFAGSIPQSRTPRRRPLPDRWRDAVWDLEKAIARIEKLAADDRMPGNMKTGAIDGRRLAELVTRLGEVQLP